MVHSPADAARYYIIIMLRYMNAKASPAVAARAILALAATLATASCAGQQGTVDQETSGSHLPSVNKVQPAIQGTLGGKAPLAPATTARSASAPDASARAAVVDETVKGELLMSTVKAADAANVCYIEPTEELRAKLTPEQFAVLVESATEPPFRNAYWNNHAEGVYVDAIDGVPLFSSGTKFDSGTGWPSFYTPINPDSLVLVEDLSYGMRRIEVRAKASGGHLGHLFDDGPAPTGLRYCINSASLRFIPREKLASEGYAELEALFSKGS